MLYDLGLPNDSVRFVTKNRNIHEHNILFKTLNKGNAYIPNHHSMGHGAFET